MGQTGAKEKASLTTVEGWKVAESDYSRAHQLLWCPNEWSFPENVYFRDHESMAKAAAKA